MNAPEAHQHFSAQCFNEVWGLLDKPDRSEKDDELMKETAHASLFHWLKREDCSDQNLSIGYWQLSRIYSVLKNAAEAKAYAEQCVAISPTLSPFFQGYGYEALARSEKLAGNEEAFKTALNTANEFCARVEEEADRSALEADLKGV